jgi:hypothetical protein
VHLRPEGAGLARSHRDGKMVMYELTGRGHALLGAVAAQGNTGESQLRPEAVERPGGNLVRKLSEET